MMSRSGTISIAVVLIMIVAVPASIAEAAQASAPSGDVRSTSSPIVIDGDSDFAAKAVSNSWGGDGDADNPYRIAGLTIRCDANVSAIDIRNTTAYFRISDCSLLPIAQQTIAGSSYSAGVKLTNVINGRLSNITVSGFVYGINLMQCHDIAIDNSTAEGSKGACIYADYCRRITLENSTLVNSESGGVTFNFSEYLLIQHNNASYNEHDGFNLNFGCNNSTVRWNLASHNGWYGGTSKALFIAGRDSSIYENVLVGPGGKNSMPAGSGIEGLNHWSSPNGVGNYYAINFDATKRAYTTFLGKPICSLTDHNGDGISDEPYTIRKSAGSGNLGAEVDSNPLIYPMCPPIELMIAVGEDHVLLNWDRPKYLTDPFGHYLLTIDDGVSRTELDLTGTSFLHQIADVEKWNSLNYTIRWVGTLITSGPSEITPAQNPDRPSVSIISDLRSSRVTLYNLTTITYGTLDPRSILVEWIGHDSNSDAMNYFVKLDDGGWLDNGQVLNRTFTNLSEGIHTVTVRAIDNDQNQAEDSMTFTTHRVVQTSYECAPTSDGEENKLRVIGRTWDAVSGTGVENLPIDVAYSIGRGSSWAFASVTSGTDGRFEFVIDLEIKVIHGLMLTVEVMDLNNDVHYFTEESSYAAFVPQGQEHIFMAHSESTISDLSYSSRMVKFNVSAGDGNEYATSILVPKVSCGERDISVTLDGVKHDAEIREDGDYWVLNVRHNASSHQIVVDIEPPGLVVIPPGDLPLVAVGLVGAAVLAGITVLAWKMRRRG